MTPDDSVETPPLTHGEANQEPTAVAGQLVSNPPPRREEEIAPSVVGLVVNSPQDQAIASKRITSMANARGMREKS